MSCWIFLSCFKCCYACVPSEIFCVCFQSPDCPKGTYGVNCTNTCGCGRGATSCDAATGCVCEDGWIGVTCEADINECDDEEMQKDCSEKLAVCVNSPGSFSCQCEVGYAEDDEGICRGNGITRNRLVGLVVKASASRAEDPGFESRLRRDFWGGLKNWHSSGYPARRLVL